MIVTSLSRFTYPILAAELTGFLACFYFFEHTNDRLFRKLSTFYFLFSFLHSWYFTGELSFLLD